MNRSSKSMLTPPNSLKSLDGSSEGPEGLPAPAPCSLVLLRLCRQPLSRGVGDSQPRALLLLALRRRKEALRCGGRAGRLGSGFGWGLDMQGTLASVPGCRCRTASVPISRLAAPAHSSC